MPQRIEQIRRLLAEENIGEAAKSMAQIEPYKRINNLNYYKAILAIKRNDFRAANKALDLELKGFSGNDQARILKTLISEPFCQNAPVGTKELAESERMKKDNAGIEPKLPSWVVSSGDYEDSIGLCREKKRLRYLNLGCGSRFHSAWTNVDFNPLGKNVIQYDLNQGIPFDNETFDAIYNSHLLEHFAKSYAPKFLKECFRVLKGGGILRVVVPDLEAIAALYLRLLNEAAEGDKVARERYEWIVMEMFDQMVRNTSGGEMEKYLEQDPMPAEDFVKARCGSGAIQGRKRSNSFGEHGNRTSAGKSKGKVEPGLLEIGHFRLSGEVHQWMYDRYSLGRLMEEVGFQKIEVVKADESKIPNFNSYYLDIDVDGSVRKPDSLFIEAMKPVDCSSVKKRKDGGIFSLKRRTKGSDGIRVVHLCMQDFGGAGNAAYRLHKGLLNIGVDSTMLVLNKMSKDITVKVLPDRYCEEMLSCLEAPSHQSSVWNMQIERWHAVMSEYPERPSGLEMFTDGASDVRLDRVCEIQDADIVHLHWVAGVIDWPSAPSRLTNKPIIWTLHDMNPFTGGCHYAGECRKYIERCGACPQLGSTVYDDLASKVWQDKYQAYQNLNLSIVTPSRWLGKCASESKLLGRYPISVIPNGFPLEIFQPHSKKEIRRALKIPDSGKVILFGADSVFNKRKGFIYLLEALNQVPFSAAYDIIFLTFGALPRDVKIPSKYTLMNLGPIGDEKQLAMAYSVADVFVLPSLEDNLPNTVVEAMGCGVPVVGFDIGGMPDMIEHKKTGYLSKAKDIKGLMCGIEWVIASAEKGTDFLRACREKVEREYGLEGQANAYREVYEHVIGGEDCTLIREGRNRAHNLDEYGSDESQRKAYQSALEAIKQGNQLEGIGILEKLVSAYPEDAVAYHDLGRLYVEQGNRNGALQNLGKAAEIGSNIALFQKDLADFYYEVMGDVDAAIEHYSRAHSCNPKDVNILLMLGHISVSKKKLDEAEIFYSKVLEIEPSNKDAREKRDAIKKEKYNTMTKTIKDREC